LVPIIDCVKEELIFSYIGAAGDRYESGLVRVPGGACWSLEVTGRNAKLVIDSFVECD